MNNLFLRRINGLYIDAKAYVDYCNEIGISKSSPDGYRTSIRGMSLGGAETLKCNDKYYFLVASLKRTATKLKNSKSVKHKRKQILRGQYIETALSHFLNSKKQSRIEEVSKEMKAAVQRYEEQTFIEDPNIIQFDYAA